MKKMNPLFRSINMRLPIVQAPMAGACSPELVAAVSNAGGLGSLAGSLLTPEHIVHTADSIRKSLKAQNLPFSINLFVQHSDSTPKSSDVTSEMSSAVSKLLKPFYDDLKIDPPQNAVPANLAQCFEDQLDAIIAVRPSVASFAFGIPTAAQIQKLQKDGILVCGTATTVQEAVAWKNVGADMICAQGGEAGGHRGSFLHATSVSQSPSSAGRVVPQNVHHALIGTMALVPQVVDAAEGIPVIAAGGISDGRGIAAALCLGASAAQIGTAFLGCAELESVLPAVWRQAFEDSARHAEDHTRVTRAFSGRFARGFQNTYMRELDSVDPALIPDYPIMNALTSHLRQQSARHGRSDFTSLWAGQGAPSASVKYSRSMRAGDIVSLMESSLRTVLQHALSPQRPEP
ncbi:mitochondrial nitronate monooxygenase [Andalucia godoyi]|uniref:Mitochondrial nitronate monooxygenase n=1 Tax=Andalucia godoyi TaxID=505711 RepID=A0A8K0F405_ANDGO|nr:mitochondrial nitronate monooxygenase [Andalucia godoyi]|eukprot:ANDGO_02961.mRNA.1 mitochondrial nitronate monooxygenase